MLYSLVMAQAPELYGREMHDGLGFWATWLPGALIRVGDCGTVEDFAFARRTSLSSFGVSFQEREPTSLGPLHHSSSKGVSIAFHTAARASAEAIPGLPNGRAGVTIGFEREGGVVFAANNCRQIEIEDIHSLEQNLQTAYLERGYPANYVVVTAMVRASSATVLVSSGKKASVTLTASADLTEVIDLARADAGLSIARSRGLASQHIAEGEMTPLFKVMGFKRHWLTRTPTGDLEDLGSDEPELQRDELRLDEAAFEDYAERYCGAS
jgi:hypothetical protein